MSKKKNFNQEKNPLQMVLYIAAAAILLACICFLIMQSKKRNTEFLQEIERLDAMETEMVIERREPGTEEETEQSQPTEAAAGNASSAASGTQTAESETLTSETALSPQIAAASVLILNGTRQPGVAGVWKTRMEESGYTNIYTASYTPEAAAETAIYTDRQDMSAALQVLFPNATLNAGTITSGIEAVEGEPLPETVDAYIVVGKNDASVQQTA